ncbi:MAG: recombination mediator RecR [Mycoplasmataceae bacterium]|nr:recombination mediator RecR [Mycoplasmataceae bacterium]
MKPVTFEHLIDALKTLPGVGKKQADRIAYFLLLKDSKYVNNFMERIKNAKEQIHFCQQCNNFSQNDLCDICANPARDQTKLAIVSSMEDLQKIEDTNSYTGLYYVLNGEIDVKTRTNIDHNQIQKLMALLKKINFQEVLLATNWTINGEATAAFLKKIINESTSANVYRLALGLPINSALDYADNTTLKYALKNKTIY